jgi:hypothetical protein
MAERRYADEARLSEFRVEVVIAPVYRDALFTGLSTGKIELEIG